MPHELPWEKEPRQKLICCYERFKVSCNNTIITDVHESPFSIWKKPPECSMGENPREQEEDSWPSAGSG
jgi:hypothetical protein